MFKNKLLKLVVTLILPILLGANCKKDDKNNKNMLIWLFAALNTVQSVEFTSMPAPTTADEMSKVYTTSQAIITMRNGITTTVNLAYNELYKNTDLFNGVAAGAIFDKNGAQLKENGNPYIAETPDANSLIKTNNSLYLLTHFEYQSLSPAGVDMYGKLPMTTKLAELKQDGTKLSVKSFKNIDFSGVNGLWIPCAGSLSPWNTHLGSEEYEPDARTQFIGAPGRVGSFIESFSNNYFGADTANPYNYGLTPETTVDGSGNATVKKWRTLGRISRELAEVMPDQKTIYMGDDGTYNVVTMFVANTAGDLSAGTLYAAKWTQTSHINGGTADLTWVKLGSGTHDEIETLVANGTKFSDIFDVDPANPATTSLADTAVCTAGYTKVMAGHNAKMQECLKVKAGMEKAAAFLETRRYASYMGATTEFEKLEGVTSNKKDKKLYMAMTRISNGMENKPSEFYNHIAIPKLSAGAVYEMVLGSSVNDSSGAAINSEYVGKSMGGLLLGADIAKDSIGNTCAVDRICNPDNIKYSEVARTLFIGEDSSTAHIINFLWAFNVDKTKLSRILSLPAGAESTGLQVVEDLNGQAFIMSNFQHAGEYSVNIDPTIKTQLQALIDPKVAKVGYISGIPALK